MEDFKEFALSDEELSQLAGGQMVVSIIGEKSKSGGGSYSGMTVNMTIDASKLDMWKERHKHDIGDYKISKPYDKAKGEKPVF